MTDSQIDTKPNGPVAAAFLAAGVASLALGLMVVGAEASAPLKDFLNFDKNFGLGSGVGPLSGKTGVAVIAYVISWVALHLALRGKDVNFRSAFIGSLVLVGLGFALTFPPVFLAFHAG